MKHIDDNPYATHENVSILLPWYVNKTLHGAELNAVEQHLKVCLLCNRELLSLQNLSALVNQESPFDSTAQGSFARFKKRLHSAETEQLPVVTLASPNKWHSKINFKQLNAPRPALALAAVVLLAVLLPRFMTFDQFQSNDYRTLSDAETVNTNQDELKVIFKDNTSKQTIDQILASIQGHIINGPNEQSLYTIAIKKTEKTTQVIDSLSILRNNATVVFAEPVYASLSKTQPENTKQ